MKTYYAEFEKRGIYYEITIVAESYKAAKKIANEQRFYYGRLWSLRVAR